VSGEAPPELSRLLDVRQAEGKAMRVVANEAERAALAVRFGLVRIDSLEADLELHRKGRDVEATGRLVAAIVQPCAVSAEDLDVTIDEGVAVRFVPGASAPQGDVDRELDEDEVDEIEYADHHIDVGEAVAQSLGLAIDPYLTGPEAEAARKAAGIGTPEDSGPFAALKGLKLGK